jgi:hypothetical protein
VKWTGNLPRNIIILLREQTVGFRSFAWLSSNLWAAIHTKKLCLRCVAEFNEWSNSTKGPTSWEASHSIPDQQEQLIRYQQIVFDEVAHLEGWGFDDDAELNCANRIREATAKSVYWRLMEESMRSNSCFNEVFLMLWVSKLIKTSQRSPCCINDQITHN